MSLFGLCPIKTRRLLLCGSVGLSLLWVTGCERDGEEAVRVSSPQRDLPASEARVRLTRLAASPGKSAKDISPYDEAVAWHHYRVDEVLAGELRGAPEKIRVAHWTVLKGEDLPPLGGVGEQVERVLRPEEHFLDLKDIAASNELDFETEEDAGYVDVGPLKAMAGAPRLRWDYGGVFSHRMRLYWAHRARLKGVVLGNSHAAKAVAPEHFPWEGNASAPAFLNLACAAAPMSLQCRLAREYALRLPQLRLVIWVVSPRDFNLQWRDAVTKERDFLESPGYQHDQAHPELFTGQGPAAVSPAGEEVVDRWGWEHRASYQVPEDPATLDAYVAKHVKLPPRARFAFDENAWSQFQETVEALTAAGMRVVLLTPPCHPVFQKLPVSDPDGTLDSAGQAMVQRLAELDQGSAAVWFRDWNRDGRSGLSPTEFYDLDHLNAQGAERFTRQLVGWIEESGLAEGW